MGYIGAFAGHSSSHLMILIADISYYLSAFAGTRHDCGDEITVKIQNRVSALCIYEIEDSWCRQAEVDWLEQ